MSRRCGKCFHGEFERGPSGRIKRGQPGKCLCHVPMLDPVQIPWCVTVPPLQRVVLWPDDGKDCRCFEKV